jgi:predicted DNA-binding transcriptional regulator AlpA
MARAFKIEPVIVGGRLLTPKQAGEFLGVPEGTLAQWRSQRRGPVYIKLEGRLIRYRSSDLELYIASRTVENPLEKCNA